MDAVDAPERLRPPDAATSRVQPHLDIHPTPE